MQNLESVAQKMAELLHNYVITYIRNYVETGTPPLEEGNAASPTKSDNDNDDPQ